MREAVRAAVRLGGDVNAANQAGDTALHVAAALGYDTVVQLLAEHGANVNVKNKRGITPLRRGDVRINGRQRTSRGACRRRFARLRARRSSWPIRAPSRC